jgi:hypothetical protein
MKSFLESSFVGVMAALPLLAALLIADVLRVVVGTERALRLRRGFLTFSMVWLLPFAAVVIGRFAVIA